MEIIESKCFRFWRGHSKSHEFGKMAAKRNSAGSGNRYLSDENLRGFDKYKVS